MTVLTSPHPRRDTAVLTTALAAMVVSVLSGRQRRTPIWRASPSPLSVAYLLVSDADRSGMGKRPSPGAASMTINVR